MGDQTDLELTEQSVSIKTQSIFVAAAKRANPWHWIWDGVHSLSQGHELIARNRIAEAGKAWWEC